MGATASSSILSGSNTANLALFSNIQGNAYWSGSDVPNTNVAWLFNTINGDQRTLSKNFESYAWAVRPGDVAASSVLEPGSLALLGLGLMALRRVRRR